ncbi:hypothetical protein CA14_002901 [Aspergillus flavus]|uniref:Uncharacterized protein n=1 Tax=Aspergillus flavus TaxID=5059 RepID=A0AB74C8F9_ASPFL|nr:hypothetical protein CA14_002901 [Aspergillus flavus]
MTLYQPHVAAIGATREKFDVARRSHIRATSTQARSVYFQAPVVLLGSLEHELRKTTQERGDPVSAASSVAAASQDASALSNHPLAAKNARRVEDEHGRLIVERGSTQYVTHEALISLGNQWPIYPLDSQSSELHAIGTLITESCYDTKLPLNINDSDLSTESSAPPDERIEFTESTFCLIRCEMTVLYRRSFLNAHPSNSEGHPSHLLDNRLGQLEEIRTHLQNRYLQYYDTSIPVQWGTMTARMPLIEISPDDPKRDQLLLTAIGVVEFAYLLETDPRTVQWAWLFERYPQWAHGGVRVDGAL